MPNTDQSPNLPALNRFKNAVTIQHILPRLATLGLTHFHEIWMLALKKQYQCLRSRHTLLATS